MRSQRLALSSNGCRSWTRPRITGRIRAIARSGTTWFALVERPNLARAERFRLLASTNLGRTWRVRANRTAMKLGAPPTLTTGSLVADRVTPNRLWLIHEGRLGRSDDGGRHVDDRDAARHARHLGCAERDPRQQRARAGPDRHRGAPITRTSSSAGANWSDIPPPATGALPNVQSLIATSNSRAALATSAGVWTYAF